jgi:hypothetical protein
MIVSSSKRYSVTESAKMAGGVVFRHKDPALLSKVWYSLAWILITGANLLLNMKRLGYGRGYGSYSPQRQVIFYGIALVIYVMIFIFSIQQYLKYNEFRLCPHSFYLGGTKYDRKHYTYSLDGEEVVFRSGRSEKRITVPEKKRKEVLGILGKYYTKS